MQALLHSMAEGATNIFGNISHKKVPIGGVKRLDIQNRAGAPPHVQLWVFSIPSKKST